LIKKTKNSIELSFLIFKLGILKEEDHNGPFLLLSFAIWRIGISICFTYYDKLPKMWITTVGES
tara:strand:+ start:6373 stop:6564 length:192 start_codon:yes stop_codon:yes gene_type:complete